MEKEPIKSPIQKEDIEESKIEESIENLTEDNKKSDSEMFISAFLKALKGEKGEPGEKGEKGNDGKNYVLTDLDKKAIANVVYSIVQDRLDEDTDEVVSDALIVIEKKLPEKIKLAIQDQKPMIVEIVSTYFENLKKNNTEYEKKLEKKVESASNALKQNIEKSLNNFWESKKKEISKQYKPETAEKIIERIRGKMSWHDLTERPNIISGLAHLVDVSIETEPSNNQVLKWDSTLKIWTPGTVSGGGGTEEIPVGSVDGSNNVFTVENEPKWIVVDSNTYFEGAGYTYSAGTLTLDTSPVSFIRSIY